MRTLPPRWMLLSLTVLLLVAAVPVVYAQEPPGDDLEAELDALLAEQRAVLHIPGLVFVLVEDGEITFSRGVGLADVREGIPMDPERTVMRIGSVSKLFVAAAVMQLVEQGRLDLHADISQYLDDFPRFDRRPEPVTLAQLLTHTAGFGDYWSNTTDPSKLQPLGVYLAEHMPPRFTAPDEVINYSNHGYALAAYVVERVSSVPFDRYVEEQILAPLGMAQSGYLLDASLPERLATGYLYDGTYVPQPVDYDDDYPGGSMVATAADMARFMIAQLSGGCYQDRCILAPDTVAQMQAQAFTHHPDLPGWTLGFQEEYLRGQRSIGHGGAIRGFTSDLLLLPELGVGYFVSFNHESTGEAARMLSMVEDLIVEHYLPDEPPAPDPYPASDAEHLAGSYRPTRHYWHTVSKLSVMDRELQVTASGDRLVIRDSEYVPIGPLLYQEEGGERRIAIREDEKGQIEYLFWGPYAYARPPWYASTSLHRFLFKNTGWVWGVLAVLWPAIALVRRLLGRQGEPVLVLPTYLAVVVMALCNAGFLLSLDGLFWRSEDTQRVLLVLPLISTGLGTIVILLSAAMWWRRWGSLAARVYFSCAGLVAGFFAWFLNYWNFIGFHLG